MVLAPSCHLCRKCLATHRDGDIISSLCNRLSASSRSNACRAQSSGRLDGARRCGVVGGKSERDSPAAGWGRYLCFPWRLKSFVSRSWPFDICCVTNRRDVFPHRCGSSLGVRIRVLWMELGILEGRPSHNVSPFACQLRHQRGSVHNPCDSDSSVASTRYHDARSSHGEAEGCDASPWSVARAMAHDGPIGSRPIERAHKLDNR